MVTAHTTAWGVAILSDPVNRALHMPQSRMCAAAQQQCCVCISKSAIVQHKPTSQHIRSHQESKQSSARFNMCGMLFTSNVAVVGTWIHSGAAPHRMLCASCTACSSSCHQPRVSSPQVSVTSKPTGDLSWIQHPPEVGDTIYIGKAAAQ